LLVLQQQKTAEIAHEGRMSKSEILDQQPPSNVEAERKLIATILIDPVGTSDALDDLSVHLFTDPVCREFARGILTLNARGQRADSSLIVPWLKSHTELEAPGADYLDFLKTVATATFWPDFLREVKDIHRRREARLFFERGLVSTANGFSTRDAMQRELAGAKLLLQSLGELADRVLDWRRYVDGKRAEWEKQSALLDSIIGRLQVAAERVRPEET
jgi:hypothetical protein